MGRKGVRLVGDNQEGMVSLGTDAWNSAEGYSKIKILRLLVLLDKYEDIALYGASDIDDIITDPSAVTQRREEGLRRFLSTMRQLLGNCKFAIKKANRSQIDKYIKDIDYVEERMIGISFVEQNMVTGEYFFQVNEDHFNKCYKILRQIKDDLNFPINASGLIFRESDEEDLEKIMDEIVSGG
jgi:hypothetical protein